MGALFLATKVEECPRRLRDIINVFDRLDRIRCAANCARDTVQPASADDLTEPIALYSQV